MSIGLAHILLLPAAADVYISGSFFLPPYINPMRRFLAANARHSSLQYLAAAEPGTNGLPQTRQFFVSTGRCCFLRRYTLRLLHFRLQYFCVCVVFVNSFPHIGHLTMLPTWIASGYLRRDRAVLLHLRLQ